VWEMAEGPARLITLLQSLLPWVVWCVWWLWGVNWRKAWPMLAEGGWAPVVLLLVMSSLAWASIDAHSWDCVGLVTISNGWWQLGSVCSLAALALFCGWLQGYFGWTPREISVEPPPAAHEHHEGHVHH
jgi:hypothetical protein